MVYVLFSLRLDIDRPLYFLLSLQVPILSVQFSVAYPVCPLKEVCLSKTSSSRTITRSVWQRYMDEVEMIRKTSYHENYYALRKQTLERVFADSKEKHGCHYTRYRGLHKAQDYSCLLFANMNMKKMALWSTRKVSLSYLFHHCLGFIDQFKQIKTGLVLQVKF